MALKLKISKPDLSFGEYIRLVSVQLPTIDKDVGFIVGSLNFNV